MDRNLKLIQEDVYFIRRKVFVFSYLNIKYRDDKRKDRFYYGYFLEYSFLVEQSFFEVQEGRYLCFKFCFWMIYIIDEVMLIEF